MLRKIRISLAVVFYTLITLLFLDFTGTIHTYFGWMADIQFVPALLALNVGVVVALLVLTFLFGRVYCSVICPLGVMQDVVAFFGKKSKKNRYSFSPERKWLRYSVLVVFLATILAPGVGFIAHLVAPYSAYGRIANNLFAPFYQLGNNVLAYFAERANSYAFYTVDVWIKSLTTFAVAAVTFVLVAVLAWRGGRTWCNTVCPVGTILGFFAKYSLYKPVIDTEKCNSCGLCGRNCKASCINSKEHAIDYSRCVACFDCIDKCNKGAISFKLRTVAQPADDKGVDKSKRAFLTTSALIVAGATVKAQEKKVDGGLATIIDRQAPNRKIAPKPAGSLSVKHFTDHCTACQLCVSACPNQVLVPSSDIGHLMQPEMSFERGYCRPECVKCSTVCPADAIKPIDTAEKSSISVGYAVWLRDNCVVVTDGVSCGNCATHCPVGAIQMLPENPDQPGSLKVPVINPERCIGCGECEFLCPARPLGAIYVEGREVHKEN
ncbi:MAG: 4Fe-4S dicluster domain-containing protein [Salinivirgaceae bacterium]|nr:4Fe-4S dicluster domain-containing protein [Salinivirgaceae bacterium]